jgi:hypothetical protein
MPRVAQRLSMEETVSRRHLEFAHQLVVKRPVRLAWPLFVLGRVMTDDGTLNSHCMQRGQVAQLPYWDLR